LTVLGVEPRVRRPPVDVVVVVGHLHVGSVRDVRAERVRYGHERGRAHDEDDEPKVLA
jgi:hypothetical protein